MWSKPPNGFIDRVQRVLSGMAERRVAQVVRQRQRFGQVLVQPKGAGDGAGDLGDLDAVGQPGAVEIALVVDEDLGLVLQFSKRGAVDDAVAVALPGGPGFRLRLMVQPAARRGGGDGIASQGRASEHATRIHPAGCIRFNGTGRMIGRFNSGEEAPILCGMEQFAVTDRAAARIAEIVAETKQATDIALACRRAGRRMQRFPVSLRA